MAAPFLDSVLSKLPQQLATDIVSLSGAIRVPPSMRFDMPEAVLFQLLRRVNLRPATVRLLLDEQGLLRGDYPVHGGFALRFKVGDAHDEIRLNEIASSTVALWSASVLVAAALEDIGLSEGIRAPSIQVEAGSTVLKLLDKSLLAAGVFLLVTSQMTPLPVANVLYFTSMPLMVAGMVNQLLAWGDAAVALRSAWLEGERKRVENEFIGSKHQSEIGLMQAQCEEAKAQAEKAKAEAEEAKARTEEARAKASAAKATADLAKVNAEAARVEAERSAAARESVLELDLSPASRSVQETWIIDAAERTGAPRVLVVYLLNTAGPAVQQIIQNLPADVTVSGDYQGRAAGASSGQS